MKTRLWENWKRKTRNGKMGKWEMGKLEMEARK